MKLQKSLAVACAALQLAALQIYAQPSSLDPQPSPWPSLARPYGAPSVPAIRLANSARLHALIRAGNLYLTVEDALALAIENNLDLEIQRYDPLLADWNLQRQQGGGPLRGASANSSQVGAVASGQGVLGSETSVGMLASTGGSGGGGGTVTAPCNRSAPPRPITTPRSPTPPPFRT